LLGAGFNKKIKIDSYIIVNMFNNNNKMLKTRVIIFKDFHNIPDKFRLIMLRIIAEMQKAILRYVILPCKISGK